MQKADKLILEAQADAKRRNGHIYLALITPDNGTGKWKADCQIWSGLLRGQGKTIQKICRTRAQARRFVDQVAAEYPNTTGDVPVIIYDMERGERGHETS